jgi:hypothetical protein
MWRSLRWPLLIGIFFILTGPAARAQEEKIANPYYKFWAGSKPGDTAVCLEVTKMSGPEGKFVPDGVDEKRIAYKVIQVGKDRVVVEMVVTEDDLNGYIQAAPTRQIYPAKLKKSHLDRIVLDVGDKTGEETVKVGGKELKCKTVTGTLKRSNGEQVDLKLWLSDAVPGSIVKQVRTARQKGDVVAETTTTLQSYKKAE